MKIKIAKRNVIFIVFALLIVSNSRVLIENGISNYFEYFAHFLLMIEIFISYTRVRDKNNKYKMKFFILTVILFSIGLVLNNIDISNKIRLVLTMCALSSYIFLSNNFLSTYECIRYSSYGIICGIIITTLLAAIFGIDMFSTLNDSNYSIGLDVGFTGGMQFKNFFGGAILSAFIGIYVYYKNVKKTKMDFFIIYILMILLILSGSRGTYILALAFFMFNIYYTIENSQKKHFSKGIRRVFFILIFIFGVMLINVIMSKILINSDTYSYRIRGTVNYVNYIKTDKFHLIFGYSEMAFGGNENYVQNVRRFLYQKGYIGYNGSYEMGFINTLIKNGVCGLIGFVVIFAYYFNRIRKSDNIKNTSMEKSIIFMLLLSSLVESYVCNIHSILGVYCYLLLSGLINVEKEHTIE